MTAGSGASSSLDDPISATGSAAAGVKLPLAGATGAAAASKPGQAGKPTLKTGASSAALGLKRSESKAAVQPLTEAALKAKAGAGASLAPPAFDAVSTARSSESAGSQRGARYSLPPLSFCCVLSHTSPHVTPL